jgi:hypothetical protein
VSIVRILPRVAAVLAALGLLNASLTFYDVWPTPGVEWHGHVSVELAAAVLLLALVAWRRPSGPSRWLMRGLAAAWMGLVLGRYVDVMSPALYGRPINLYWDIRHVGAVAAMMTDAVSTPLLLTAVVALLLFLGLVFLATRWAFATVATAQRVVAVRGAMAVAALAVCGQFAAQTVAGEALPPIVVAPPVTATYFSQARLVAMQMGGTTSAIAAVRPRLDTDLGRVRGADVLLVFMESYGAVTVDRPVVAAPLTASRARFAADVAATGRAVVSAMVDSPTFGGASWLAHISLLTGVEARDEGANAALMSQSRDTLISTFADGGYRTVALMPGLGYAWPEGAFYGFDAIYDTEAMAYGGPRFGWWTVPDQFALARLDVLEAPHDGRPRFVFFPTTSTHAPFAPIAPYQPDWPRLFSTEPYAATDVARELAQVPNYLDMTPSYIHAVDYGLASIGGYLRQHPGRDLVLVLIGDHQPAALVAGEGASWNVPVHVVASRPAVLAALRGAGFSDGVMPERRPIGPMHALLPTLLTSFGTATQVAASPAPAAGAPDMERR